MPGWRAQLYESQGAIAGIDPAIIQNALKAANAILARNPDLTPVLTLRHLASMVDVDYSILRGIASRSIQDPYRTFRIRKRSPAKGKKRFRVICVPSPVLLLTQRWISENILSKISAHPSSVAYSKGNRLVDAAKPHCGAKWVIKLDVLNFFESITEIAVYRVFRGQGYQPLVSIELARICTRAGNTTALRSTARWRSFGQERGIKDYAQRYMGHLPQGAPTSPMLSNLVCTDFDNQVQAIATHNGLTYTRYADDIALSSKSDEFSREIAAHVIGQVYEVMGRFGLSPNATKAQVIPPGGRKVVLGLLVDGSAPRLPRDFKAILRRHLYYLTNPTTGPSGHAKARQFASIIGMRNHIGGLLAFARQIEPVYATKCEALFKSVKWPI